MEARRILAMSVSCFVLTVPTYMKSVAKHAMGLFSGNGPLGPPWPGPDVQAVQDEVVRSMLNDWQILYIVVDLSLLLPAKAEETTLGRDRRAMARARLTTGRGRAAKVM